MKFDFCGWATRAGLRCSDGRTIMKDAFKHNDGETVPLVWNHQHSDPNEVLGHALLENRDEGVYAYCTFNDTESGKTAKLLVQHGDVKALSIYANQLKQNMSNVLHGNIREVSLVLAGANPGAFIESIIAHGEESDEEAIIYTGEDIMLSHSDEDDSEEETLIEDSEDEDLNDGEPLAHADDKKEEPEVSEAEKKVEENVDDKTVGDILETFTEDQMTVLYALVGEALAAGESEDEDVKHSEGGNEIMKHNVFDNGEMTKDTTLSHAEQLEIINLAKSSSVGSLRTALGLYAEEHKNTLAHGIDEIEKLFPDYATLNPGAPELVGPDRNWVGQVMKKAHKSPVSRIRTRQADAQADKVRAYGYNNRESQKKISENVKLIMRTTDPQTVYRRDELHRDDIIDITDFDVIAYQKSIMKHNLEEEIAMAALIGDGREDGTPDKISEEHIRSVWNDKEQYTIRATVDIEAAKKELQGTSTGANFGDNYVYAEAFLTAALYSREKYRGKGTPDLYCTPHLLNVMLLARDLNGRRIYDSADDLAKALNVGGIYTVEQMEGKKRTDDEGNEFKLLGLFVNMANYTFGCTKGGEITEFEDFDIDFNKMKYLMETRVSGALTEVYSAIAIEEPVVEAAG